MNLKDHAIRKAAWTFTIIVVVLFVVAMWIIANRSTL